jgi:hypothetical protein
MNAKASFLSALVLTVLIPQARSGDSPAVPDEVLTAPIMEGGTEVSLPHPSLAGSPPGPAPFSPLAGPTISNNGAVHLSAPQTGGLSGWLLYTRPECCGPLGGHGPIMAELYVRNGPSIPVGGGVLGVALNTGWLFQGGVRSLFFNSELTGAWVIDLGISHTYNPGIGGRLISVIPSGQDFDPDAGPIDAQLRQFQRTCFNIAGGRETYLYVWDNGVALRAGAHVGGQLGTIKVDWEEMPHFTDMLWAVTLAGNLDLEIPWGCCTLYAGFRTEWNYIFESDIVQHQNDNDLQSVNLLISTGVRY